MLKLPVSTLKRTMKRPRFGWNFLYFSQNQKPKRTCWRPSKTWLYDPETFWKQDLCIIFACHCWGFPQLICRLPNFPLGWVGEVFLLKECNSFFSGPSNKAVNPLISVISSTRQGQQNRASRREGGCEPTFLGEIVWLSIGLILGETSLKRLSGVYLNSWTAWWFIHTGVSKNRGTPKSSILIGFSIINHPFWGIPIFGNTHIQLYIYIYCISCNEERGMTLVSRSGVNGRFTCREKSHKVTTFTDAHEAPISEICAGIIKLPKSCKSQAMQIYGKIWGISNYI